MSEPAPGVAHQAQGDAVVVLDQVVKRFGSVVAVDRLTLEIRRGEFFSMLGPTGCGKSSVASPKGNALGEVTFGSERVPEEASLQAFFGANKSLLFFVQGSSPVSLEFVSQGTYVNSGQPPYGLELKSTIPAIATVPGAALASTKTINIKVGAAIKKGKKLISYGALPSKCPKGGFPVKAELIFGGSYGGEREFGIPAETVTKTYKAPCPPK